MRELILHIGTAKAGSTSLQEFFFANKDKLQQSGVAYLHGKGQKYYRALVMACMNTNKVDFFILNSQLTEKETRNRWQQNAIKSFSSSVTSLSSGITQVVVSCEGFFGQLSTSEEIKNLRTVFSPHFSKISVIIYLRRQDLKVVSLYSSRLRLGSIDDTILDLISTFDYLNRIRLWKSVFGKESLIIKEFDKEKFQNRSLIDDFLAAAGLDKLSDLDHPEPKNESLSYVSQEVLRQLNLAFPSFEDEAPNRENQMLKEYVTEVIQKHYSGKGRLPSKKEALTFYSKFEASNDILSKEYLGGRKLFSSDFSMYPEQAMSTTIPPGSISLALASVARFYTKNNNNWHQQLLGLLQSKQAFLDVGGEKFSFSHRVYPIHW